VAVKRVPRLFQWRTLGLGRYFGNGHTRGCLPFWQDATPGATLGSLAAVGGLHLGPSPQRQAAKQIGSGEKGESRGIHREKGEKGDVIGLRLRGRVEYSVLHTERERKSDRPRGGSAAGREEEEKG